MITIKEIKSKVKNGKRISPEEALYLFQDCNLLDLGSLAQETRYRINPKKSVSYVIDTNLNYYYHLHHYHLLVMFDLTEE